MVFQAIAPETRKEHKTILFLSTPAPEYGYKLNSLAKRGSPLKHLERS
jgi:hypothetical protein